MVAWYMFPFALASKYGRYDFDVVCAWPHDSVAFDIIFSQFDATLACLPFHRVT